MPDPSPELTGAEARRPPILERVIAAVRSGDIENAQRLSEQALSSGVEHPLLLNLRALDHEQAGRFEAALTDLRRAHVLAPKDFATLNACGLCLGRLERHEEALQCFAQVVAIKSDFAPGWFNRGWTLERLGEKAEAARSYETCVSFDPGHASAWANLAFLAARRGDAQAARDHAMRALALQPDNATAKIALADADMDRPELAEQQLRDLAAGPLAPFERGLCLGLLADALDAQGKIDEAFATYAQSNALFRAEAAPQYEGPGQATVPSVLTWLTRWARGLDRDRWTGDTSDDAGRGGEAGHVFLLGFPRSGTTLIETVLANHPNVVSLEERNTLHAAVLDFLADEAGLLRLETASKSQLRRYREDYWARVSQFGIEPTGKIFIDKNPFNALKLPLIYKLFPRAKVIFAVRDPRDVVLSCFRRRFNLNASTYEFLEMRRAAENYDQTMRFVEVLRPKQKLAEHRLVYEDLVADFPRIAKATCEFIGADWRDDLIDIAGRARRGDVASASSAQIARGLYSDGAGQWRRYAAHLAPIMPILNPWIQHFGYAVD